MTAVFLYFTMGLFFPSKLSFPMVWYRVKLSDKDSRDRVLRVIAMTTNYGTKIVIN